MKWIEAEHRKNNQSINYHGAGAGWLGLVGRTLRASYMADDMSCDH